MPTFGPKAGTLSSADSAENFTDGNVNDLCYEHHCVGAVAIYAVSREARPHAVQLPGLHFYRISGIRYRDPEPQFASHSEDQF